jgi:hypothetical protein
MTRGMAAVLLGLGVLRAGLALAAEEGSEPYPQSFEVTTTEHIPFGPNGTIHLTGSYGYLSVDGWDEPEVQITVIKSTNGFYEPSQKSQALERLGLIKVANERKSDTDLTISTTRPARKNRVYPLPRTTEEGVTVEYQLRVPRDSGLDVHHDNGYVWINDLTGELKVASHTGDMIVMLPDPGPYSIDARSRLGSVSSDFVARTYTHFLVGTRYEYTGQTQARHIVLRMGRGSITIKKGPPTGPYHKD